MNKFNIEEGKLRALEKKETESVGAVDRRGSSVSGVLSPGNGKNAPIMDKIGQALKRKLTEMMMAGTKTPGGVESVVSSQPHVAKPKFSRVFNQVLTGTSPKISSQRPFHPEPSMEKGMGAPYVGYYSKTFHASSKDGSYRFKSTAATHQHIVREDDNMAG